MRQHDSPQPDLHLLPIEKIRLPLQSRDELPPILAGLQWLGMPPTLKVEVCALLDAALRAGQQATGRTGLDLWQILVRGVVRLGWDADGDRWEDLANQPTLLRQMLGVPLTPWGADAKVFARQTLRDNVALLDDALLPQINARVAAAGRAVFANKAGAPGAALAVKVDTDVRETDGHFPTALNLLWDASRKCVALIEKFRDQFHDALPGWRQARDWHRRLKALERTTSHVVEGGGGNQAARVRQSVRADLAAAGALSAKVSASLRELCGQPVEGAHWEALADFHGRLDKHRDLVARRLLNDETIPAHEKVFSLFEPHTEWIQKGKHRPNVELGHRLLIATDQPPLIQDDDLPVGGVDVDQSVPVADRLLGRYGAGSLASLSFDKGFTRTEDRE
jgi:hypothetical protein